MRKVLPILAISCALSTLALAESWSGKLLDSGCFDKNQKVEGCDATSKTSSFAIDVGGSVYKLDQTGNSKAAAALKNRADRADPNQAQSTQVMAKVEGSKQAGVIVVESIDVQ